MTSVNSSRSPLGAAAPDFSNRCTASAWRSGLRRGGARHVAIGRGRSGAGLGFEPPAGLPLDSPLQPALHVLQATVPTRGGEPSILATRASLAMGRKARKPLSITASNFVGIWVRTAGVLVALASVEAARPGAGAGIGAAAWWGAVSLGAESAAARGVGLVSLTRGNDALRGRPQTSARKQHLKPTTTIHRQQSLHTAG